MAITSERLRQTFSEGGAQEIYQEVRTEDDFLGFARRYIFDSDYRVARSALWGLTKATDKELSELQVILNELMEIDYYKPAVKCLRKRILSGKYR